jgi:heptosyltransferase-3
MSSERRARILAVRSDSIGDVLLTEPALRSLSVGADVTLLCSPHGVAGARVLGCAPRIVTFDTPWIAADPPPLDPAALARLVRQLAARRFDAAVIFTSERQSALPMAMTLRLAGIDRIGAYSDHYPGSLLDLRLRTSEPEGGSPVHEVERNLALVEAMGLGCSVDRRIRVRPTPLAPPLDALPEGAVVVHPAATAAARTLSAAQWIEVVGGLRRDGRPVVVTGASGDAAAHEVAIATGAAAPGDRGRGRGIVDLVGRTSLGELASVLSHAAAVCVGNTGVMHLAAATGTPVVAAFPPTVPLGRWRPWMVPHVVVGDHDVPCAPCYLRTCRFTTQACTAIEPQSLVEAVARLVDGADGTPVGGRDLHPVGARGATVEVAAS